MAASNTFEQKLWAKRLGPFQGALAALGEFAYSRAKTTRDVTAFRLADLTLAVGQYEDTGEPFLRLLVTDERRQNDTETWLPGLFTDVHIVGRAASGITEEALEGLRSLAAEEWAHDRTINLRPLSLTGRAVEGETSFHLAAQKSR